MLAGRIAKCLLAVVLSGAAMFAAVCLAYILGLPTDSVLHGDLVFRVVIGFFGVIFFVGSVALLFVACFKKWRVSSSAP